MIAFGAFLSIVANKLQNWDVLQSYIIKFEKDIHKQRVFLRICSWYIIPDPK